MADWFSSLAAQALKLADDITDSLVQQANDAQTQLQNERTKLEDEERKKQEILHSHQLLPWETNIESRQILSDALMEKVFTIPLNERNFLEKPLNADEIEFNFSDFIPVALKLLQLDSNLARTHAKLSPKMNEEIFWYNYYCRVMYLRSASGIDGPLAQKEAEKYKYSEIVLEVPAIVLPKPAIPVRQPSPAASSKADSFQKISPPKSLRSEEVKEDNLGGDKSDDDDNINIDDLDLELENMKDIELDELGDINPDDFEEIGSSEGMDELEAQIARELAEEKKKSKKT